MRVMSGLDARFFASETRTAHMHTIKVVVLDLADRSGPLDLVDLLPLVESRLDRMPVLRRRVVPAPHGLGNPVLLDDPDFDVARHIRMVTAAAPGGRRQLDEAIAQAASTALPRDRPLWEMTIVEGLADGTTAFVMKVHHALADGVAAVALLENAFVLDDDAAIVEPFHPEPLPNRRDLYRAAGEGAVRAARSAPDVVGRTVSGLRHARIARRGVLREPAAPFEGPRTPFNVALTADRTFATAAIPLDALLGAKTAAHVTLNDAFLGLCAGAVRRTLARTASLPAESLVAAVPMATRTGRHRLSGNHVDNLFVTLRTDIADPLARLRAIHESTVAARTVRAEFGPELFERRAGLVPAALHGVLPRLWGATRLADRVRPPVNLVASCVRGPRSPLGLDDGSTVSALYSSGPILEGIGVNVTAWSYVDTLYVSVLGCAASLPDPWLLVEDLHAEVAAWADRF